MIGQATSTLANFPRSLLLRVWGQPSIHTRQKWQQVWPYLRELPHNIRLLDAGCGAGDWTLELALLNPEWTIVGVDLNQNSIDIAKERQQKLGITNVSFIHIDFLEYSPQFLFDVVLSVMSAHYLALKNSGASLFLKFSLWLNHKGILLLLVPRSAKEVPFVTFLEYSQWHSVFTYSELIALNKVNGLEITNIKPCIGKPGTLAKQLDWSYHHRYWLLQATIYPLCWLLSILDRHRKYLKEDSTLMWLLIARKHDEIE